MNFTTEQIVTILRHCGNQGDACPCADCLLKDNAKGNECMDMYDVAADKIENQFKEIKSNEQIIADLTRAVCLKDVKIKRLKELLKKATSIEGFIDYHYDEIEEALKDEV